MRHNHLILVAFITLIGISCREKKSQHPIFKFYPTEDIFEEGYVSKYYEHYYPISTSQTASTRITYLLYQKTSTTEFKIEHYNAGFWLTGKRYYHVDENALYLDSSINIWRTDTTVLDIVKGMHSKWDENLIEHEHYHLRGDFDTRSISFRTQQLALRDSTINEVPAKILRQKSRRIAIGTDTTQTDWVTESYFVEGLGYYGSNEKHEDYRWEVELVEQIPLAKFKELANHTEKRVAYIDPQETLDKNVDFKICGHEKFIADYYNSTPDGDYLYGKAALVDTIFANLDANKMMNQTGMLTFRFVVNCNGEAGRFIAKGYDLAYQPFDFPEETVQHLYEQMLKLKEWQVVVINDEPRDAYFYFTFKINNGEIIDILP